jgi:capsular polysaccharide biosynthesis protein
MKCGIWLAKGLYPAAWRERYGDEFSALLEDVKPGWRALFDVLRGALKMRLTSVATYWKLGAGFAIAGLLAATIASFLIPKEYVSTAVLRMTDLRDLAKLQERALSRTSLAQIIQSPGLELYPEERKTQPLEDVIATMRARHIQIQLMRNGENAEAITIAFRYPDREKARKVVGMLIGKLAEGAESKQGYQNLEVVNPPSLPLFAEKGKRPEMLLGGLLAGFVIGLVCAVFVRHPRRSLVFAGMGVAGCAIGGMVSLLIPDTYVSTSVIRVVPFDKSFEQSMKRLAQPRLRMQVLLARDQPGAAAVEVAYQDREAKRAQAMVAATIQSLIAESKVRALSVEYLDVPNYPASPASPNRYVIASMGFMAGLFMATTTLLVGRRNRLKAA